MFQDPSNVKELISGIPTTGGAELVWYIKKNVPGWLETTSPQFSVDLAKWNLEWATYCKKTRIEPQKVLMVANTFLKEREEPNHPYQLIVALIREATKRGFVVIDTEQFEKCSRCEEVIVSKKAMDRGGFIGNGLCQGCCPSKKEDITKK